MQNLIFILVALFGFVALGGIGLAFAGGGGQASGAKANKRLQTIAGGRDVRSGKGPAAKTSPGDAAALRRKQMMVNLKALDKQERKVKLTTASRIAQAGLSLSERNFWIGSAAIGVVVGLIAMAASGNPLVGLGAAFGGGLGLPRWLLGAICKRRHAKFTEEFPNAIDIIVRGIKSGLPVHDCLRVISVESPDPVGLEFKKLVEGLGMGLGVDQGLEKMYERMSTSEVRFFAIVLAIQQKSGGNLAEALGNLSTVLRARKLMREKVKALSGEAVASAAIIACLPPGVAILVQLTSPLYLQPLFFDPRGHLMLLVAAGMMGFGVFVMRRMINFKI